MAITLEAIRAAGGIVHSDGNIFFRDISMLQGLAGAAPAAVAPQGVPVGVIRASSEIGVAPWADIWQWLEPGTELYAEQHAAVAPFGYVNTQTGQFFTDVEPCRKNNEGHWRTVYLQPAAAPALEAPAAKQAGKQPSDARLLAHTDLLAYVLQDDVHNRLTPRVIDIAYSAFMQAKRPSTEDGGPSDWFNDTKPMIQSAIDKLRHDLTEDRAALAAAPQAPAAPVAPAATMFHDAGAIAQCTCGRYTLNRNSLSPRDERRPVCECGTNHGWSGSFKKPGADSKWHGPAPAPEAAPAAPSGLPHGWVPCILTHDGQHPEEVAYGPQIMMDRLKKWLGRYFELLAKVALATRAGQYKLADDGAHQYLDGIESRYSIERADGTTLAWVLGNEADAKELMAAIEAAPAAPAVDASEAMAEVHLLEEVCARYADDEDRHLAGNGEAYGSIPAEAGMKARAARKRFKAREAAAQAAAKGAGDD